VEIAGFIQERVSTLLPAQGVGQSNRVGRTTQANQQEFIQQLAHNHIAYYDSLKKAPGWLSDEARKAVTGVGSTKRKLYSDDDDIVYEYKRCLGFIGNNTALSLLEYDKTIRLLELMGGFQK
jgi:hypothetical protein